MAESSEITQTFLLKSTMAMVYERRLTTIEQHLRDSSNSCSSPPCLSYYRSSRRQKGFPVLIGGMVLDSHAIPASDVVRPGTTTPGKISYVKGGVARNIAECLANLETPPFLISIVGDDMAGDLFLSHWQSLGLVVDGIRRCEGTSTPVVSAIFDKAGELASAVADTRAIEENLTPGWIRQFAHVIHDAPILMLDANLHSCALEASCKLAAEAGVPVWFEPVSVSKSVRATNLLKFMTYVSPNRAELLAMAEALGQGNAVDAPEIDKMEKSAEMTSPATFALQMHDPIQRVLRAGVKYVIFTLGSQGAVLCYAEPSGGTTFHQYPALVATVVRLSGAGDCFVGGALAALCAGVELRQAVAFGISTAKVAVESEQNVPKNFSVALIKEGAEIVLSMTKQFSA